MVAVRTRLLGWSATILDHLALTYDRAGKSDLGNELEHAVREILIALAGKEDEDLALASALAVRLLGQLRRRFRLAGLRGRRRL